MAEVKRAVRVAGRVREELAWLLTRDVRDPRLAGVTVARVEMPDDLRSARVYVRLLDDSEAKRTAALAGLARATGMLRREVTKRVGLRYAPELSFRYDDGQDKTTRIEELLAEVEAERKGKGDK
jgi:ribosome-binding factor A